MPSQGDDTLLPREKCCSTPWENDYENSGSLPQYQFHIFIFLRDLSLSHSLESYTVIFFCGVLVLTLIVSGVLFKSGLKAVVAVPWGIGSCDTQHA